MERRSYYVQSPALSFFSKIWFVVFFWLFFFSFLRMKKKKTQQFSFTGAFSSGCVGGVLE